MKSIKIISILISVITIICAIAVTSSAKWWDENPFTDVKSSHWYYDAVRIANENGLVNGMSETKFAPSVKMTRAMLVQVLYNAEGIESEFTGTPFTDVPANQWYAKAVQWAYENKITSGLSDTKFGPNSEIKREELAALLYRYAEFKGMAIENSVSISEFPDANKVSNWAVKNFEWAYGNSIISGSKKPSREADLTRRGSQSSPALYFSRIQQDSSISIINFSNEDASAQQISDEIPLI